MTIPPAMPSVASIITQTHASNHQQSTHHVVCCVPGAAPQSPRGGVLVEVAR